jgi:tRNA-dihydrouridine synthase C
MLGRGVLCRPDLPRLLRAQDLGRPVAVLRWDEIRELVLHYLTITMQSYEARYAANPIKQWLGYLRYYYPQAAALFMKIKRLQDPTALRAAIEGDASSAAIAA